MCMKSQQKGFTVIEGLLAALVVVVLIFGGYYVWRSQKGTKSSTSTSTASTKAPSSPASSTAPATSNTATTQKYLTISEWGVKMPIGADASDANYVIKNGYAYLGLKSLDNTECGAANSSIGALSRFTKDTTYEDVTGVPPSDSNNPSATYLSVEPTAPKVGDYYFTYQRGNSTCLNGDLPTAVKANTEFKTDYKGMIAQ